jgi:hypothetical protein
MMNTAPKRKVELESNEPGLASHHHKERTWADRPLFTAAHLAVGEAWKIP